MFSYSKVALERAMKVREFPYAARRCLVEAAFLAAWLREALLRRLAALFACLDNAAWDAAERGSRLRARSLAADRLGEAFRPVWPLARSR